MVYTGTTKRKKKGIWIAESAKARQRWRQHKCDAADATRAVYLSRKHALMFALNYLWSHFFFASSLPHVSVVKVDYTTYGEQMRTKVLEHPAVIRVSSLALFCSPILCSSFPFPQFASLSVASSRGVIPRGSSRQDISAKL